eukprot:240126-Chlamydomonas_euryale.AAC.3
MQGGRGRWKSAAQETWAKGRQDRRHGPRGGRTGDMGQGEAAKPHEGQIAAQWPDRWSVSPHRPTLGYDLAMTRAGRVPGSTPHHSFAHTRAGGEKEIETTTPLRRTAIAIECVPLAQHRTQRRGGETMSTPPHVHTSGQRPPCAPAWVLEADDRLLALEVPHHARAAGQGRRDNVLHPEDGGRASGRVAAGARVCDAKGWPGVRLARRAVWHATRGVVDGPSTKAGEEHAEQTSAGTLLSIPPGLWLTNP